MEAIWNLVILVLIGALFVSGLFNLVEWQFNIPAIVVLLVIWLGGMYNILVRDRNRVREAWSDIEVQLKRRYDLIPNLVETVKGYMTHERQTFEKVTEARSRAMGAQTVKEHGEAENMLTGALKSLFAVAENYPDLKASQNFLELQRELRDTEDKIQAARRFYNGNVRDYNTQIQSVPVNVIANTFRFKQEGFFDLEGAEELLVKEPVKVSFQ